MTPDEALHLIRELAVDVEDFSAWQRDGIGHAIFSAREDSSRFAVVSTPGDRWFEVVVNNEFGSLVLCEDASPEEVRGALTRLVGIGMAYVKHGPSGVDSRRFRPGIFVDFNGVRYRLSRSVASDIRKVFSRERWRR